MAETHGYSKCLWIRLHSTNGDLGHCMNRTLIGLMGYDLTPLIVRESANGGFDPSTQAQARQAQPPETPGTERCPELYTQS